MHTLTLTQEWTHFVKLDLQVNLGSFTAMITATSTQSLFIGYKSGLLLSEFCCSKHTSPTSLFDTSDVHASRTHHIRSLLTASLPRDVMSSMLVA